MATLLRRRALLFASAVGAALFLSIAGCREDCTDDGCYSELGFIVFEPNGRGLAPGVWRFELVADAEEPLLAVCEIAADSRSMDCEPGDFAPHPIAFGRDAPFTQIQISFDGGLDGPKENLPAVVDFTIVHEGDVVHDERYQPDYELVKPEHCNADCVGAGFDVVVDRQ